MRREGTSEAASEAGRRAVGGGCQSGWERLLSVTNASKAQVDPPTANGRDAASAPAAHCKAPHHMCSARSPPHPHPNVHTAAKMSRPKQREGPHVARLHCSQLPMACAVYSPTLRPVQGVCSVHGEGGGG